MPIDINMVLAKNKAECDERTKKILRIYEEIVRFLENNKGKAFTETEIERDTGNMLNSSFSSAASVLLSSAMNRERYKIEQCLENDEYYYYIK